MTKTDLLALADKIEAADASEQRELLEEAWRKLRGDEYVKTGVNHFYRFQAMLAAEAYESAALMLVATDGTMQMLDVQFSFEPHQPEVWPAAAVRWYPPHKSGDNWHCQTAGASTLALAITAAALRARAEECE